MFVYLFSLCFPTIGYKGIKTVDMLFENNFGTFIYIS